MANVVVTSTTKTVKVVFNDYESAVGMVQAYFSREHIAEARLLPDGFVVIKLDDGAIFNVSTDGNSNTLLIDTVDAVAPTSEIDLCDKIASLMDY